MSTQKANGFTVVELLVVLVIIALLAGIVAYHNSRSIQARSRSSTASSNAEMVIRKAESWRAALGSYPTYAQLSTGKINAGDATLTGPAESRITDATNTLLDAATSTPTNELKTAYRACTTGAQTEWYDDISSAVKPTGSRPIHRSPRPPWERRGRPCGGRNRPRGNIASGHRKNL